jgi:hypothetical protein
MSTVACLLFMTILSAGPARGSTDSPEGGPSLVVVHPDTGSDTWGYSWFRSDEPGGPTFNWVDITTRGTLVTGLGDDNYVGPFQMQFAFRYYWYIVDRFYVGSNGFICFSSPTSFAPPFVRLPHTGASSPKDLLAVCVGDLDFTVTASTPRCYYWTNGVDSLVVSFIDVTEWQQVPNPNLKHTFQIILNRLDSSITYQYGPQQGRYNSPNNTRLCIGWQNNTGVFGHSYTYSTTPPHALMPDSGLAINIRKVFHEGLITDGGIVGGFDPENLARVMRVGIAETITCVVKNFGSASITNARVRYAISKPGQSSSYDTVIVPSLTPNQQLTVTFPRLFTPAVTGTYSALFNITVPGDIAAGNDNKTAEILSASFGVGQSTLIQFENGVEPLPPWAYSGGFGVAIDLPPEIYPVRVETVYVKTGNVFTQPMTVEIFDGSSGSPGTVLASRTVTAAPSAMNAIEFIGDNVVIPGGRFFVCTRGDMQVSYEAASPISYRLWEYTNGWAPSPGRDVRDMIIRASVRGVTTDVKHVPDVLPEAFELLQNYPNPFNPSTTIAYHLPTSAHVTLSVFDLLGREVQNLIREIQAAGSHKVDFFQNGLPSGVYFYRLTADKLVQTKKLVLLR